MNSLKLLVLLLIILFVIYLFQLRFSPQTQNKYISPTPVPNSPTPTRTMNQTTPTPSHVSSDMYQYPGSTKNSDGAYITEDSVEKITTWYKNLIKKDGFSTTTTIQTKTNGSVLNTLKAVKGGTQLSIEIRKSADTEVVSIVVVRSK